MTRLPAQAQISNGDFENGDVDWAYNGPAGWDNLFLPAGGNPDGAALIASNDAGPAGIGCLTQTFTCGEPGGVSVIELCLEATDADNGWRLFFDNVAAVCDDTVGAEDDTWTSVKGLFR